MLKYIVLHFEKKVGVKIGVIDGTKRFHRTFLPFVSYASWS